MLDLAFLAVIFLIIAIFVLLMALFLLRQKMTRVSARNDRFKGIFESIWRIEKAVLETVNFEEATGKVVNIILTELGYVNHGYEVIVLTLLDKEKQGLRRIAISNTESAARFLQASPVQFENIVIPLSANENLSVRAIQERKMFSSTEVADVLYPALSREWVDNFQKTLGIKTSLTFPIIAKDKILGSLIFSLSKEKGMISQEEWSILDSFVGAVGIALDNALLFKSLNETTQQLKVANEKLEQLDKLKDEFVSLASHELRTPMTVIKSYIWMLLEGKAGELSEKQKTYLDRTFVSTNRLINLVNDMLNISRIESGRFTIEPKPMDMGQLIAEVVTEMQPRAQEQALNLIYEQPQQALPEIKADSERIKQVLINLIGNSLKFTPKEGSITISTGVKDNFLITSVKDTGQGIRAEDMEKLFKKFNMLGGNYLTKQAGQGTGLGLYLSKALVELHRGRIWITSEGEGKGSTFSFALPIAQPLS
jgi:signal transduction histidine kinase